MGGGMKGEGGMGAILILPPLPTPHSLLPTPVRLTLTAEAYSLAESSKG